MKQCISCDKESHSFGITKFYKERIESYGISRSGFGLRDAQIHIKDKYTYAGGGTKFSNVTVWVQQVMIMPLIW